MEYFVKENSIVRKIWSDVDLILFIFAGAAAEFSVNKAVDWLYFTGNLPKDPLGRLFSTVAYAQKIVFSSEVEANKSIDQITAIHQQVEAARGSKIPDWAYRDVLFMLIDYSIRSFEVLERRLSAAEKEEIFNVFNRVGHRMKISELPSTFKEWEQMHELQLRDDLAYTNYSKDLFTQYKKHLGSARYRLVRMVQAVVVPQPVNQLLGLGKGSLIVPVLRFYRFIRLFNLHYVFRNLLLPLSYKAQILVLARINVQAPFKSARLELLKHELTA